MVDTLQMSVFGQVGAESYDLIMMQSNVII